MPRRPRNSWLTARSPIYEANVDEWERNELLLLGGREVVERELILFDWEEPNGDRARGRKDSAMYTNFVDRFAEVMTGHIFRQRPTPEDTLDFGGLGEVRRKRDLAKPTPAELIFYNADGLGQDGTQWDPYWQSVAKMAVATGHRWVYVEGPPEAPRNRADEIRGMRPYLADYSPRAVLNHHYERGQLAFAVIERGVRRPRIGRNGALMGNKAEKEYLLLTREGFNDFGETYAQGGWFLFDADGNEIDRLEGWEDTEGEIPFAPLYYERVRPQMDMNRMSRPGVTELGGAAVLHMNLESAASWDIWDAASSAIALAGVDQEGYQLFIDIVRGGSRYAPLKMNDDSKIVPQVRDLSMGAAVASAFQTRIDQIKATVVELMLNEIQVSPDASGSARRTSWTDVRSHKLATFAANIETCQNAVLPWLEGMWGERAHSASVEWKREFDLIDPLASASLFFETENAAGVTSATLKTKILVSTAKAIGFLGDDEEQQKVEAEYDKSSKQLEQQKELATQLGTALSATPASGTPKLKVPNSDGRRRQNQVARPPASKTRTTAGRA